MAKIIETSDGIRMLVSDDAPDDIISDKWNNTSVATSEPFMPTIDPLSILLCFVEETFPIVPVQANKFLVQNNKFNLTGTMLIFDYAWLLANIATKVSHFEIRMEERIYKIAVGPFSITRFLGKDINASTVDVNVSFKRDI